MPESARDDRRGSDFVPAIGDRIERARMGVVRRGTVEYADMLQVLVKWDDGSSSSLRVGRDEFRVIDADRGEGSG